MVHRPGEPSLAARVLGRDPVLDLAVLKVESRGPMSAAVTGRSDTVRLGEGVVVIGNPNGLGRTITTGIVSRLGGTDLQVTAAINGGNSGGPVFNESGELVGIVKAKAGEGLGFAIPIDRALAALPSMLLDPTERGYRLGLLINPLDKTARIDVARDGAAARAGLRSGDVVRVVDGAPVGDAMECLLRLGDRDPAAVIALEVARDGSRVSVSVTPEEIAQSPAVTIGDRRYGVAYRVYHGAFERLPDLDTVTPVARGFANAITHDVPGARDDDYALRFDGFLEVPSDGAWTFVLSSDDGSRLMIAGRVVVDNDGQHEDRPARGSIRLAKGLHPIRVEFFERSGDQSLSLSWDGPDRDVEPVPATALWVGGG